MLLRSLHSASQTTRRFGRDDTKGRRHNPSLAALRARSRPYKIQMQGWAARLVRVALLFGIIVGALEVGREESDLVGLGGDDSGFASGSAEAAGAGTD